MRVIFRILGVVVALNLIIVFGTGTYAFIKNVWFSGGETSGQHVAVLDISGVITSSKRFVRDVEEALENDSVKAIVVRINSPGGVVGPSQEMYEAIKKADAKVPVVISMGSLAASGGYYAALAGRKIYASPGTLTASIGVIMELANTEKLYNWAKVERYTLKAGKFKDVGSPLRPMKPEERDLLQAMLTDIHAQFRGAVKERRKLSDAELESAADGRVMTGQQAKAAKLVDELGGFQEAMKEARTMAKLPEDTDPLFPVRDEGLLKRLLFGSDEDGEVEGLLSVVDRKVPDTSFVVSPGWRVMWLAPLR